MQKKQSSIDWLEQEFIKLEATVGVYGVMYELIDKAKAMHKEEMKVLANDFYFGCCSYKNFEKYYNETFGGNEE